MPKDFRTYVTDTISRLKSDFGWTEDTDAFAHWAICHASDLSERDVFDDVCVGSKDDKSLDGFYIDPDQREVHLHQSKYHTSQSNFDDRAALDDFVKVLDRLKDEKASREFKSAAIRSCARRYREAIAGRYSVVMKFIVYANLTPSVTDEAMTLRKSLPPRHSLEIWHFEKLEKTYYERFAYDDPITEPVTLTLVDTDHAKMHTQSAEAVVVNIPAGEIYDLVKKYRRRLFAKDVRYFLPQSQINKQIAATLGFPTERQFFWFYNNGISLSCSDFAIDPKKRTIRITEPQIINGCQTAESIFNFGAQKGYHNLKNVSVLARVIKLPVKDKTLGGRITARTNTQNPQTARNLCANYVSQVSLKERFDELIRPVFYQTKDGEWESLPPHMQDRYTSKEGMIRMVDNRDAAQAYIAFARDEEELNPVEARRLRSSLFDITKVTYEDVFPEEPRTPYEYLVPCLFLTYVEKRIRSILKEVGEHTPQNEEERVQDEIKASVRYAKWFIVGILGWLVSRYYGRQALYPTVARLLYPVIGDFQTPSELGKEMLDFAFDVIEEYSDEETRREEDEEEQQREEFDPALAYRQDRTWKNLKRKAARNYKRETERGHFKADLFPKLL